MTLVGIMKLPEISMDGRKVEAFIHRCSACWQIYKEIRETTESPRHFRDHFLKAGESYAATGVAYSEAEETEFGKIDFASIVCPILRDAGNDATA